MSVKLSNQSSFQLHDNLMAECVQLAGYVFLQEGVPPQAELSVTFVDLEVMESLNKEFRDKEGATDVLSFPCDEIADGGLPVLLGDIVISPDIASEQSSDVADEVKLLLVHGILHLLGYTHTDDEETSRQMEAREKELLTDWTELWAGEPRSGCKGGSCCG
ncbi:MAG: rRNA maturation RNase YbeY [Coriobacteriia bacterium]|nr:rRNA maturation RNase YbeY [Coriobacteriia bacterium]